MTPKITHSPVQIATREEILEGKLLLVEGALVAVASHLSESHNGEAGKWFIEAAFGHLDPKPLRTFDSLDELISFVQKQYQ